MTRRLWALFRKELRTLFASPIAYIVLTAFVALTGVYFFQHLLTYNRLLFVFQSEAIGAGGFDAGTVPLQVNSLNELFIPASNDFSLFLLAVLPLVGYGLHGDESVLEGQRQMARAFNLPVVWGTDASLEGRSLSVARDANPPKEPARNESSESATDK